MLKRLRWGVGVSGVVKIIDTEVRRRHWGRV